MCALTSAIDYERIHMQHGKKHIVFVERQFYVRALILSSECINRKTSRVDMNQQYHRRVFGMDWLMRDETHSIASSFFFISSGRSLNFVFFVNRGAPDCC